MADVADVEFFWDPMCPWAWITSRWVAEVARQSDYTVDWRFICLRLLNEHKDYGKDFPEGYVAGHGTGLKLLRVAAAIRDAEGPDRMGELYTTFGTDIHVNRRRTEIVEQYEQGLGDYLREVGIEDKYIGEANNDAWDTVLRAERDEALALTGADVGTPIIAYNRDGVKQAFFGPVISEIPPRERAVELWDAVWALATFKGFAELKRSLRDRPNAQGAVY
jgi:hypothetical protein